MVTGYKKKLAVCVITGVSVLLVYAAFSPENCMFFPKCPFYLLTGLECPSCGSQRALHALLTGDIQKALEYNYFLVLSVPYAALAVFASFSKCRLASKIKAVVFHRYALYLYCVLFVTWWIVRNII